MGSSKYCGSFFAALVFTLAACSATPPPGGGRGVTLDELAVSAHATDGSCSTTVVRALTEQLVDEINCIRPGTLSRIDGLPGVSLSTAAGAAPYLDADAARALGRAGERGPGTVSISSALRTLPQQYLLRKWYERGRCGISAAASPGHSNHEAGLAVDVSSDQVSSWRGALEAEGFAWFGSRDRVHFEHAGDGMVENLSVLAFQRLWNRNHPEDRIAEDGAYGAQTESRLARAPADGFAVGACGDAMPSADGGAMSSDAGVVGSDAGSIPSTPDAGSTPPPAGGSLASVYRGLSLAGHEVPRTGLANPYLPGSADIETLGTVTTMDGRSYVRGRVSWFGGPHDTGVTTTETGAVSGERLRALNDPDPADAATVASRPEDFYFLAMRWRYLPASSDLGDVGRDLAWWRAQRLVIVSAATGAAVVVRPVDWGPHPDTGRVADVSHQTLRALSSTTDDDVLVAFVDPSTPLGPIASSGVVEPPPPPPPPMCVDVQGACAASSDCCGGASCRRGVTFPERCCAEAAMPCSSGADCCGYMSCSGGVCQCRAAGRACLDDGDCCSGSCASGSCR